MMRLERSLGVSFQEALSLLNLRGVQVPTLYPHDPESERFLGVP